MREIQCICKNEDRRVKQHLINNVVRDPHGRLVLKVMVSVGNETVTHHRQEEVEQVCVVNTWVADVALVNGHRLMHHICRPLSVR